MPNLLFNILFWPAMTTTTMVSQVSCASHAFTSNFLLQWSSDRDRTIKLFFLLKLAHMPDVHFLCIVPCSLGGGEEISIGSEGDYHLL